MTYNDNENVYMIYDHRRHKYPYPVMDLVAAAEDRRIGGGGVVDDDDGGWCNCRPQRVRRRNSKVATSWSS